MLDEASAALDPIRSLGAQLWVTELAPFGGRRRYQIEGWISDWNRRGREGATSVGFTFELEGADVRRFHLVVHGRVRLFREVTGIEDAVRKLQVAVKIAQGRIVLVEPEGAGVAI
ncbi:MAG TPA: hypothetical protein VGK85_03345 [Myxococcaceae bacterium]